MTGDMVGRLRAKIDEAENIAQAAAEKTPAPWAAVTEPWEKDAAYLRGVNGAHEGESCGCCSTGTLSPAVAAHAAANGPDVVLRTIQAHREIVDRHKPTAYLPPGSPHQETCRHCDEFSPCADVRSVAAIYLPDIETGDTPK